MISLFIARPTWLHRWPAGLKLFFLAAASLIMLPISDWRWLASGCALTVAAYISLGAVGRSRLLGLRSLLVLVLGIGGFQFLVTDWPTALVSMLRICFMVMFADLVSATTPTQSMLRVFMPLLSPLRIFGIDTKKIALAFALMIRLISVLFAQWQQQYSAWVARSPRRPSIRLLVPFLAQALRTTDHTAEALEARLHK